MCLDFHHVNPSDKRMPVAKMASHGYTLDAVKAEINKCVLVCRNCHRKIDTIKEKPIKITKALIRKQKIRDYVNNHKNESKCKRCGESDFRCLDYHHVNQNNKFRAISVMVKRGMSIEKINNEIAKCELLCANCHKLHHAEFGYSPA